MTDLRAEIERELMDAVFLPLSGSLRAYASLADAVHITVDLILEHRAQERELWIDVDPEVRAAELRVMKEKR